MYIYQYSIRTSHGEVSVRGNNVKQNYIKNKIYPTNLPEELAIQFLNTFWFELLVITIVRRSTLPVDLSIAASIKPIIDYQSAILSMSAYHPSIVTF